MVDYIPQTRHPRLFLVMLASIGYMEGEGVMRLNNWSYLAYKPRTIFFSHIKPTNSTFSHDL